MSEERFCALKECPGHDTCPRQRDGCPFEYDPQRYAPEHRWKGEGPPPRRWRAPDGGIVYRSFSDYCD